MDLQPIARGAAFLGAILFVLASTHGCSTASLPPSECLNPQPHPPSCGATAGEVDGGAAQTPGLGGSSGSASSSGGSGGGASSSGGGSGGSSGGGGSSRDAGSGGSSGGGPISGDAEAAQDASVPTPTEGGQASDAKEDEAHDAHGELGDGPTLDGDDAGEARAPSDAGGDGSE